MKRAFDLVVAGLALVVTAPLLAFIALVVRLRLGSPVLFRQVRPGLDGEPFTLVKFRTMLDATAPDGTVLPDAERLTRFGSLLRASSLDELPELWNIVRGDMSLVGPRPLLPEYLDLYTPRQARRHEVRPGLTGWAQINGRNSTPWPERLEMDVWYVENRSLWLDLRILALTLPRTLARRGVTQDGQATVEYFTGQS